MSLKLVETVNQHRGIDFREVAEKLYGLLGEDAIEGASLSRFMSEEWGVEVTHDGLTRIGRDERYGTSIVEKILAYMLLREKNAGKKDSQYSTIANLLVNSREINPNNGRYYSNYYIEGVADECEIDTQLFRRILRLMRAEILMEMHYWAQRQYEANYAKAHANLQGIFSQILTAFINGLEEQPQSLRSSFLDELENAGGADMNIWTFYNLIYTYKGMMRAFAPHEAELFKAYYDWKIQHGSPFSRFDEAVLHAKMLAEKRGETRYGEVAAVVEELTGVSLGEGENPFLYTHVHFLIWGTPSSPFAGPNSEEEI